MRVVSVAYLAFGADLPDPARRRRRGRARRWVPVRRGRPRLAFDHAAILADGLERARAKLEYTPLATAFVGAEFTIAELRAVYAAVWGADRCTPATSTARCCRCRGSWTTPAATTERGGERGGPRAQLYRAGDARLLHPALLRPPRRRTIRWTSTRRSADARRPLDRPERVRPDDAAARALPATWPGCCTPTASPAGRAEATAAFARLAAAVDGGRGRRTITSRVTGSYRVGPPRPRRTSWPTCTTVDGDAAAQAARATRPTTT